MAVDDCRHDGILKGDVITCLAEAFSVRDLHEQIVKSCPPHTPIPSVQWLILHFWPKRSNCGFARWQTGKLSIKFMIQSRRYASAIFVTKKSFPSSIGIIAILYAWMINIP